MQDEKSAFTELSCMHAFIAQVNVSEVAVKTPGINAAHKKWVRQLESQVAAQKLEEQLRAEQEASKQKSVGEFSAKLRATILSEGDTSFWKATQRPGSSGLFMPIISLKSFMMRAPAQGLVLRHKHVETANTTMQARLFYFW